MKKDEIIHGYHILEDFSVAGGKSKVSFAEKYGKQYFIKEFLFPKYPIEGSSGSERTKEKKKQACIAFETKQRKLNDAIGGCCVGTGGNIIYTIDFFREGATYYKVTEKIDVSSIKCEEISRLSIDKILLIAKTAAHSLKTIHNIGVVHGDLKPDNLLIKEKEDIKGKNYVAKLIDLDDSFFETDPPSPNELVGTLEYYSPEQATYIINEDDSLKKTLTCKSDIFSLGVIFCEYFTGKKPILPEGYKTTWKCVQDGSKTSFGKTIPDSISKLISKMLSANPNDRPSCNEILSELKRWDKERCETDEPVFPIAPDPDGDELRGLGLNNEVTTSGALRGTGLNIAKK